MRKTLLYSNARVSQVFMTQGSSYELKWAQTQIPEFSGVGICDVGLSMIGFSRMTPGVGGTYFLKLNNGLLDFKECSSPPGRAGARRGWAHSQTGGRLNKQLTVGVQSGM